MVQASSKRRNIIIASVIIVVLVLSSFGALVLYQQRALTDGSLIWKILGFDVTNSAPIVDGTMIALNAYDNQLYAYSKGPSAMTVEAQPFGSAMVIRGTVIDISAGTKQQAQATNFPSGVPAVSDASQSGWMEYVYMQQQCPTNVTGVPVNLYLLDSNGNYRQIGNTTSDGSGMFTYTWKPDISGDYTLYASAR